ncbi:MAG: TetR/AcrR family transcriptional regulator [Aggregatilineales bacterium]
MMPDDDKLQLQIQPEKPIRADAARNHRILLRTAQRLFREQPVTDVTMSAIAKAAGVGKGTLYRHFEDKADLCHALLDETMREFQNETLEKLGCTDAEASLRWFLQMVVDFVISNSDLLHEASLQSGSQMWEHPAHSWWHQTILALLQRLEVQGDAAYMADNLYMMLDVQTIRYQQRKGYDVERIKDGLWMLVDKFL